MRIYEGSPRQDYEEVLRAIGGYLDQRGMREVLVLEAPDGFIVQGLVVGGTAQGTWSEAVATVEKETASFLDDDIGKFIDESLRRRGSGHGAEPALGRYEAAFRVIGRYIDTQKPRDVFFFEQSGAFVLRLHRLTQTGAGHELVEFTPDDVTALIAEGPTLRQPLATTGGAKKP